MKRALAEGVIELHVHDIRAYSKDKHNKVDDTPYGGGPGMLMTCQPIFDAIRAVKKKNKGPVIFFTPQGERFKQEKAEQMAELHEMILLCGRYEGIDQRVRDELVDEEISIGDFVMTGGELAAMVLIDALSRLLPGVLGKKESALEESFSPELDRMLEYPQYTKPAEFEGLKVPEVLQSGKHAEIKKWRMQNRRKAE